MSSLDAFADRWAWGDEHKHKAFRDFNKLIEIVITLCAKDAAAPQRCITLCTTHRISSIMRNAGTIALLTPERKVRANVTTTASEPSATGLERTTSPTC